MYFNIWHAESLSFKVKLNCLLLYFQLNEMIKLKLNTKLVHLFDTGNNCYTLECKYNANILRNLKPISKCLITVMVKDAPYH